MSISIVLDATHANISAIPTNVLAALYTTGTPDIKATTADFNAHPNAIHICQDHGSDVTADILDSEVGAATPTDCVNWLPKARASFSNVTRAGQRWPGIYASLLNLPPIANAFVAAKITNVPLWVAHWGIGQANAISLIANASGPWPIVGVQFQNQPLDDISVFTTDWLNRRSTPLATVKPPMPPGQWNDPTKWDWKEAAIIGVGLDNNLHEFEFNKATNSWPKIL